MAMSATVVAAASKDVYADHRPRTSCFLEYLPTRDLPHGIHPIRVFATRDTTVPEVRGGGWGIL